MLSLVFDFGFRANNDTSPTGFVSVFNSVDTANDATSREIRRFDIAHKSIGVDIRVVNHSHTSINDLTKIMCWDVGCHTHGNTCSSIDEEVRNTSWKHFWFFERAIEVIFKIDSILIKVVHHGLADTVKPCLRVPHCGRTVTINRAKVSLSINKAVSHCPILSQSDESSIHRRVTMRVVFTEHITDDTRTFLIWLIVRVAKFHHSVEDTSVYRLESISHIRQGTRYDDRHRIVYVGFLHRLIDVHLNNSVLFFQHFYKNLIIHNNLL